MEKKEKNQKKFLKVEAKKNLYKNNNALLDFSSNQNRDNIKKKFNKRPIIDQRNTDYINNDLTKKAVEYHNLKKLKKDLSYKYDNNNEYYENMKNTLTDKDLQNVNKNKTNLYKKESYSIENKPLKLNLNNQNNNNYLSTAGRIRNNEIIFNEEYKRYGLTERRKNYSIEPNNYNNSILNITVNNQIKESPLFEKIKIPKIGHSIGIIEMIKNYNNENYSNKFKIEKYDKYNIEGIAKKKDKKKKENDKYNKKNKDLERKKIKCLNDQKEFDEPKNKTYIGKKNFSYQKKIFNIKNNSTNKANKKKSYIKRRIYNNDNNNMKDEILNKTLSLNNFEMQIPFLTTHENNNKNEEMFNNLYIKKENFLYKRYINSNINNNIKKNNSFYKKMKNNKAINIKYDSVNNLNENNSDSNIEINNNHNADNNFINKNKSELEIRQKDNIKSNSGIGSPMINTKMKDYRNQIFRENLEDDWNFYQTLPKISHSLKRNKSNSSRNSNYIKEIKINMGSTNSQNEKESINNKTNNYFYSGDNFSFLKEFKIGQSSQEEEINNNTNYESEEKMLNPKYNDIQNKLIKTNSSININKKNILYLKPKNKQKKNLKSIYNSNYNIKNNDNKKIEKLSDKIKNNNIYDNYSLLNKTKNINNEYEILFNNDDIRKLSLSKEKIKIYKKPVNKKILNNQKMSPKFKEDNNNINDNSLKNKDEIIYIENNSKNNNNKYLIINKEKNISNNLEDFNKISDLKISNFEIPIKIINKIGFIKKYYNHCIKLPISKKINLNKICYFTKINIIKIKKKRQNNIIKQINNNKIQNINKSEYFDKNIKIEYELDKNKINNERKTDNSKENELKYEKYIIKTEKGSIKNDIIYLLNMLAPKNILSIENQLTKLIMTSNHLLNIEKNEEDNVKLFLNDIIKNENVFIDILLNKINFENKFKEVYSKLCSDLCNKYLNSINEIIINKFIDIKNNSDKYNIITNLKLQLNEKSITKLQNIINKGIDDENKEKIIYLFNYILLSLDYDIIKLETCNSIINILFNELEKNINNKYCYLDLIIYFIIKLEKRDSLKDKEIIIGKINDIINSDINENIIPNYIKNRINKFKSIFNIKENINKNMDEKEQKNIFEGIALLIKEDMENYYLFLKNKEIDLKSNINENIENQYSWPIIKSLKKIDLEEIIKYYINICIHSLSNYEKVICFKSYIKYIIESVSFKLSLNKMRAFHNEILQMLANINNMCIKNKFMFEIIGYLLYILIINELCDIKDINIFINKEDESKIYICKVIKYTILSSERDIKNFYKEFKNLDLFKNCSIFEENVTLELKDLLI